MLSFLVFRKISYFAKNMHPPLSACYPWAALGIVLYLTCAVGLSMRGFSRTVSPPPGAIRELIGSWMRATLAAFEPTLERLHITPMSLTFAQLGFSCVAGLAYAQGGVFLGGCFVLGSGILDLLDGSLARRTQQASRRGAFLDSVIDRYAEFFTFLGLGIFFAHSWLLWVIVFGFFGSLMVSYTRARAEGLGTQCRSGLMQRGERYVLLSLASWLSVAANHLSCSSAHFILIAGLIFMAFSTNITALSRVRMVATALKG